jgi:hypothetical protein
MPAVALALVTSEPGVLQDKGGKIVRVEVADTLLLDRCKGDRAAGGP